MYRLNVYITDKARNDIIEISTIDGLSETSAVTRAITAYAAIARQLINGKRLALFNEDGTYQFVTIVPDED